MALKFVIIHMHLYVVCCSLDSQSEEIENGLFETKEQISSVSEELAIMIR